MAEKSFCENPKMVLYGVVLLFLVMSIFVPLQSTLANVYRPPNPVMDYAPQDIGIYDGLYGNLDASDCRSCHGDRVAGSERHKSTASAFADCPDGCPLSSPDCLTACHTDPDPANITSNCLDCHINSPHHVCDLAESGRCNKCHSWIVETYSVDPPRHYPFTLAPTPASCENCHWWDDPVSPTIHPPGTPVTLGPSNDGMHPDKLALGFDPMNLPSAGTHWETYSPVFSQCYFCHWGQADTEWNTNPYDPCTIRYCENCHSHDSLHTIEEHVTDGHGLTANQKCIACHGGMPLDTPTLPPKPPAITQISPIYGSIGTACSISGVGFGTDGSILLTSRMGETDQTQVVPSGDCSRWEDNIIEFTMPSGLTPRNYNMRVETPSGVSNMRVFTLTGIPACIGCPSLPPIINTIEPTVGAPGASVTIHGDHFGDRHMEGRKVKVRNTGVSYSTKAAIYSWMNDTIRFRMGPSINLPTGTISVKVKTENSLSDKVYFKLKRSPYIDWFDHPDTMNLILNGTGFGSRRKHVLEDGYGWKNTVKLSSSEQTFSVEGSNITIWSDSQIQLTLPQVPPDFYGVIVKRVYFYDTNSNGGYDPGVDQVYQEVQTDPQPLKPHVILLQAYTADINDTPEDIFGPGDEIHYHFVYDIVGVGNVNKEYKAIRVFLVKDAGTTIDEGTSKELQTPGNYHSIMVGNAPTQAGYYTIKYKIKVKKRGMLFDTQVATSEITVQ